MLSNVVDVIILMKRSVNSLHLSQSVSWIPTVSNQFFNFNFLPRERECFADDTWTNVASLSSTSADPLLAGLSDDKKDDDITPGESGTVKANKGMILRKSVEYIRYLQQLVDAQATRNRELEAALASTGFSGLGHTRADDHMHELMLHQSGAGAGMNGFGNGEDMFRHMSGGYHAFDLATMPEHDDESSHSHSHDVSMGDQPSSSILSSTSPSAGSGTGEDDEFSAEEERGRRGRDGRPQPTRRLSIKEGDVSLSTLRGGAIQTEVL